MHTQSAPKVHDHAPKPRSKPLRPSPAAEPAALLGFLLPGACRRLRLGLLRRCVLILAQRHHILHVLLLPPAKRAARLLHARHHLHRERGVHGQQVGVRRGHRLHTVARHQDAQVAQQPHVPQHLVRLEQTLKVPLHVLLVLTHARHQRVGDGRDARDVHVGAPPHQLLQRRLRHALHERRLHELLHVRHVVGHCGQDGGCGLARQPVARRVQRLDVRGHAGIVEHGLHAALGRHARNVQEPAAHVLHVQLLPVPLLQLALRVLHKLQRLVVALHVVVQQRAVHLKRQRLVTRGDHLGLGRLEAAHDAQRHERGLVHDLAVVVHGADDLNLLVHNAEEVGDARRAQRAVGPRLGLVLQVHHQDVVVPGRHRGLHALDVAVHEQVEAGRHVGVGVGRHGQPHQRLLHAQPAQRLHVLAHKLHDTQRALGGQALGLASDGVNHNSHLQVVHEE
mmetsp:Transcript_7299/g.18083  ORF Transcript_7299/g.18083 Transcript_7299/m.18083 type:complete len:451 (+) Transcript_7299:271-1623(+)